MVTAHGAPWPHRCAACLCDIGHVDGAKAYRAAEDDLSWAGYRNGKVVALFSKAEDAEAWLAAVDKAAPKR